MIESSQQAKIATDRELALTRVVTAIEEFTCLVGEGDVLEDLAHELTDAGANAATVRDGLTRELDDWQDREDLAPIGHNSRFLERPEIRKYATLDRISGVKTKSAA